LNLAIKRTSKWLNSHYTTGVKWNISWTTNYTEDA